MVAPISELDYPCESQLIYIFPVNSDFPVIFFWNKSHPVNSSFPVISHWIKSCPVNSCFSWFPNHILWTQVFPWFPIELVGVGHCFACRILILEKFGMWLASVLSNSLMSMLSILVKILKIFIYIYIKKLLHLYLEQLKLVSIAKGWALSKTAMKSSWQFHNTFHQCCHGCRHFSKKLNYDAKEIIYLVEWAIALHGMYESALVFFSSSIQI